MHGPLQPPRPALKLTSICFLHVHVQRCLWCRPSHPSSFRDELLVFWPRCSNATKRRQHRHRRRRRPARQRRQPRRECGCILAFACRWRQQRWSRRSCQRQRRLWPRRRRKALAEVGGVHVRRAPGVRGRGRGARVCADAGRHAWVQQHGQCLRVAVGRGKRRMRAGVRVGGGSRPTIQSWNQRTLLLVLRVATKRKRFRVTRAGFGHTVCMLALTCCHATHVL